MSTQPHFSSDEREALYEAFSLLTQPGKVVNVGSLLDSLNDCIQFSQGTHPNQPSNIAQSDSTLPFSSQIESHHQQYQQYAPIYLQLHELIGEACRDKTVELSFDQLIAILEGYLNSTRNLYTQDDLRRVFLILSNGREHITADSLRTASTLFNDDISIQSIISTFQQSQDAHNTLRFPKSMTNEAENDTNPILPDNDIKVSFQQFVLIMKTSPPHQ